MTAVHRCRQASNPEEFMTAQNRQSRSRSERDRALVRRDEWLLDEAITETFPASDPVAPYQHASDERATPRDDAAADGDGPAGIDRQREERK
jgi:hypothetical protein